MIVLKHVIVPALSVVALLAGCGRGSPPAPAGSKPTTPATTAAGDKHDKHDKQEKADKHDDQDRATGDHGHGSTVELGTQTIGAFTVKASHDGPVEAGKEAPVDVWITPGQGAPKVASVRFWIGARDAKGSTKAKAELETDNFHTHVEVPDPLPPDSKLWVEIETDAREKLVGGFDLKAGS